jgi:hypothetical protein
VYPYCTQADKASGLTRADYQQQQLYELLSTFTSSKAECLGRRLALLLIGCADKALQLQLVLFLSLLLITSLFTLPRLSLFLADRNSLL